MRPQRNADCHPDRKHKAGGLCHRCYDNPVRREKNRKKATCHPALAHWAKGLCRKCYITVYLESYQRSNESKARRAENSWNRHGISLTIPAYDRMFKAHGGVCAVCKRPPKPGYRLSVDHDHETGFIRGLLCDFCNRRLLIKRNTIEIFESAAAYLRHARIAQSN